MDDKNQIENTQNILKDENIIKNDIDQEYDKEDNNKNNENNENDKNNENNENIEIEIIEQNNENNEIIQETNQENNETNQENNKKLTILKSYPSSQNTEDKNDVYLLSDKSKHLFRN